MGSCSRQGSLGLGVFSHKNVGGLDSEQNSGCLETWNRLGEEAGTGRTRRSSSLSHHPAALALPKAGVPAQPRDHPTAGRRGGLSLPGQGRAAWQPCAAAATRGLCSSRFGRVPRPAQSLAGCLQHSVPRLRLPLPSPYPLPQPQQAAPGPGDPEVPSPGPALTPACTTPSGRGISAPRSSPPWGEGAQL